MSESSVSDLIAAALRGQGIERVYSLPGGHMKPLWHSLDAVGVRIVTARTEGAAVHMAQAEADLGRRLAVAIVTAGPGVTNAVTGTAAAFLGRSPLLVISTRVPLLQDGMGALEEVDQVALLEPVTRATHAVRDARHALPRLDLAIAAALGEDGPPGPVFYELPADMLRERGPRAYVGLSRRRRSVLMPDRTAVAEAAELIAASRRPLVISGREALSAGDRLPRFVAASKAVYLDTRISRDALSTEVGSYVPALRARAMAEADLVITVGRQLDFELGFGSPAVFRHAERFLRVGRASADLVGNRRGDVELRADLTAAFDALHDAGAAPVDPDEEWLAAMVNENRRKSEHFEARILDPDPVSDGLHPYTMLAAVNRVIDAETIAIADGGDTLSWARAALHAPTYLDLGAFGCLGIGVPFAIAAKLAFPARRVIAVVGDGAFGFNAMELETAVREGAPIVVVVANNSAWNIERVDQVKNYGGKVLGTELSASDYSQLARSLGAHGERVLNQEDLDGALARALQNAPAVVDVRISREPESADTKGGLALVPPAQALVGWDRSENEWLAQAHEPDQRRTMTAVTIHQPSDRAAPRGYSEAVSARGAIVAVSGQLAAEDVLGGGDFNDQFVSSLTRFGEVVRASGANVTDVVMLRIYVTDLAAYKSGLPSFGDTYGELLGGQFPATTLVEVSGFVDDRAKVEIEGLAVLA